MKYRQKFDNLYNFFYDKCCSSSLKISSVYSDDALSKQVA